jgi:hypothetical protein
MQLAVPFIAPQVPQFQIEPMCILHYNRNEAEPELGA